MLTEKQQEYLSEFIEESYGTSSELANLLDEGIEMLFYVDEETFDKRKIQNVVSAVRDISKALRRCD